MDFIADEPVFSSNVETSIRENNRAGIIFYGGKNDRISKKNTNN